MFQVFQVFFQGLERIHFLRKVVVIVLNHSINHLYIKLN